MKKKEKKKQHHPFVVCWILREIGKGLIVHMNYDDVTETAFRDINGQQKYSHAAWLGYTLTLSVQIGMSKQCRPWSDSTERGVWSGSILFAVLIHQISDKSTGRYGLFYPFYA